ncbi:hypothetical protein PSHT_06940, partial [Puccinia striiformis]
ASRSFKPNQFGPPSHTRKRGVWCKGRTNPRPSKKKILRVSTPTQYAQSDNPNCSRSHRVQPTQIETTIYKENHNNDDRHDNETSHDGGLRTENGKYDKW